MFSKLKTRSGKYSNVLILYDFDNQNLSKNIALFVIKNEYLKNTLNVKDDNNLYDYYPLATCIIKIDGTFVSKNKLFEKMIAYNNTSSIYSIFEKKYHDMFQKQLHEALNSAEIIQTNVELLQLENNSIKIYISKTISKFDNEKLFIIVAINNNEQRTLQESFIQAQKMQAIGQLAGGVAHDFNNVLTAIIGYSDLLLTNHRPTDPSFQDIIQIKQNANRAASLVRQLLAFSRRQTLRPEVLKLGEVLSDLQNLLKRLVGENIELEFKHQRDLWLVKADSNQFDQVIINLVVNARDAMNERGKIILRTKNITKSENKIYNEVHLIEDNYVLVEVEDNGIGMTPEIKSKIFEPFFTTKEVGKGTGLGLSMVYGIIKQTGGFIFCESTLGKGTIFRIFLPQFNNSDNEYKEDEKINENRAIDLTGHGVILLVEDEDAVRAFSSRALVSRGYEVLEASSGIEALEIINKNHNIDLIISDVIMPEMDGPTMYLELRKKGINIKVIFVSGYADETLSKKLEGEYFEFLPKPFTLKQLIEIVKHSMLN